MTSTSQGTDPIERGVEVTSRLVFVLVSVSVLCSLSSRYPHCSTNLSIEREKYALSSLENLQCRVQLGTRKMMRV